MKLADIYNDPDRVIVTAHRGCSGEYPENTMIAFEQAVCIGADIIEFDLRGTRDLVPVILHDPTIDRTSNGTGVPADYTLDEMQKYNFSMWHGPGSAGERLTKPAYADCRIPTFEELLEKYAGKIGMNIQVYDASYPLIQTICDLYRKFDMYDTGYLTMSTYADADIVSEIDGKIELCVLEKQGSFDRNELLELSKRNIRFVQPYRDDVTPVFCDWIRELGLGCNMFYSNTDKDNRRYLEMGLRGFLTDYPVILQETVRNFEGVH